jgi:hypothetical protein
MLKRTCISFDCDQVYELYVFAYEVSVAAAAAPVHEQREAALVHSNPRDRLGPRESEPLFVASNWTTFD